jgi:hypothetical protein
MAMPYHHTQRGILIVVVCLASAVFAAATVWRSGQWSAAIVLIALIAAALVFSSLTVEVNGKELRWYFGPGLWTYRLSRDEIQTVAVVRNHGGMASASGCDLASGFITCRASTRSSCA